VIFHNAKFDIQVLDITPEIYHDTKLMAFGMGEEDTSLSNLAVQYLGEFEVPSVRSLWKKGQKTNEGIPPEDLAPICCEHALLTYRLYGALHTTPIYEEIDLPLVPILIEMEQNGVYIDLEELARQEAMIKQRLLYLEEDIKAGLGDINLNAPEQVGKALTSLGLELHKRTPTGQLSVDKEALLPFQHIGIVRDLLEFRELTKTLSTYLKNLKQVDNKGRIHTTFDYTATGRLSSRDPNLQNLSNGKLRKIVAAPQNYQLISIDWSQLELRVAAVMSEDREMISLLESEDMHLATAILVFNDPDRRYDAKQLNFAVLYGAGLDKIAMMTGLPKKEVENFQRQYFKRFPQLQEWLEEQKRIARDTGLCTNQFGRIRKIPEISYGTEKAREAGERKAVNTPIQSTAVDIVKKAMIELRKELPREIRMVLQVHDEILLEVPDDLVPEAVRIAQEVCHSEYYPVTIKGGKDYYNLGSLP
jgi:DNA polymerase-1